MFCANIDEGSGRKPFRVRWSGLNDETSWTTGTDQSDFQDVFGGDIGQITGLVGGESATIFMENGIAVAYYVGSLLFISLIWSKHRVAVLFQGLLPLLVV